MQSSSIFAIVTSCWCVYVLRSLYHLRETLVCSFTLQCAQMGSWNWGCSLLILQSLCFIYCLIFLFSICSLQDWVWPVVSTRWWCCTPPPRMTSYCVCSEGSCAPARTEWASWWECWWTTSTGQFHNHTTSFWHQANLGNCVCLASVADVFEMGRVRCCFWTPMLILKHKYICKTRKAHRECRPPPRRLITCKI